jgi:hypothetical protein
MGLKFCNEAIMCLAQLYPPHPAAQAPEGNTPLQVIVQAAMFLRHYLEIDGNYCLMGASSGNVKKG